MIEIDLICPNCGGRLEININREKSFCPYCDSEFSVYRKLNEKLEQVKKLCLAFDDMALYITKGEDLNKTQTYRKAQKNFGFPEDEEIFLICDMTVWETCKKGFVIGTKGLYICGEGMKRSKYFTWEMFKTLTIYGRDELVIGDICFTTSDVLVVKIKSFLQEIQRII